ncbi:hypothetical protein PGT21_002315 [Puccinia graminis f. sp. tritici]|uniref:Uncharacterized protein n=1 Tax=Puccinia graminis f. sp. tritici TaxID=56615 RepID=A0A5B0P5U0_PUCGR|nr:hypothetical protein PGT21_002315 [Puccinia graminis f. sp. tritici]KAA1137184.1 hypothetical protein PGTUg99_012394 [Puccinia graminis f. sp. tritici]
MFGDEDLITPQCAHVALDVYQRRKHLTRSIFTFTAGRSTSNGIQQAFVNPAGFNCIEILVVQVHRSRSNTLSLSPGSQHLIPRAFDIARTEFGDDAFARFTGSTVVVMSWGTSPAFNDDGG